MKIGGLKLLQMQVQNDLVLAQLVEATFITSVKEFTVMVELYLILR
jgi:hypothetical protein